jgi:hypothetical protein
MEGNFLSFLIVCIPNKPPLVWDCRACKYTFDKVYKSYFKTLVGYKCHLCLFIIETNLRFCNFINIIQ